MATFFDLVAPLYGKARPRTARTAALVARAANFAPTDIVLDIGGGAGSIAALLAPQVGSIVVVDPSAKMAEQCGKKGVACVVANAEYLPFADATVDKLVVVDAFHHIQNQGQALVEMRRVLRPGGQVVAVEYNPNTWQGAFISVVEWMLGMGSTFYMPHTLAATFEAEKFAAYTLDAEKAQYVLVATK